MILHLDKTTHPDYLTSEGLMLFANGKWALKPFTGEWKTIDGHRYFIYPNKAYILGRYYNP